MTPQEIKELRASMGLTQMDFCQLLGVAHSTFANWETGKHQPSKMALQMLKQIEQKHKDTLK
jgi:DNA-binding transcriptional regulator YiaG